MPDVVACFKFAVRFSMFAGLVLGFMVAWFSRNRLIHLLSTLFLALCLCTEVSYRVVTGHGFTYDSAWLLVTATDSVTDTVRMYWKVAFVGVLLTAGTVVGMSVVLRRYVLSFRGGWAVIAIPFILAMIARTWYSRESCLAECPLPFRIANTLGYAAVCKYKTVTREEPYFKTGTSGMAPHVVFVVDESIIGEHLSINGYARDTSPYLAKIADRICNLGIASSGGNCSYTSECILYSGVRLQELLAKDAGIWKKPTIMQYASQAGYKCLFLDGHRFRNMVQGKDACKYMDVRNSVQNRYQCDRQAADDLVKWVASNQETFTYLVKAGAHFPYEAYYPREARCFAPVLETTEWSDDLPRSTNSYDNAVRWACDGFFEYLLPKLEATGKDVLIVYTSDHGQALPGSVPGARMPHGEPNLPPITANVPLLILGTGSAQSIVQKCRENETGKNNISHFELFPTLLRVMGYDRRDVAKRYGLSLFDEIPKGRTRLYFSGPDVQATSLLCKEFSCAHSSG